MAAGIPVRSCVEVMGPRAVLQFAARPEIAKITTGVNARFEPVLAAR